MTNIDEAIEAFWQARHGGDYPIHWSARLEQTDAYRVNLALIQRHEAEGRRQAGWKVGLTARAIRDQFGLPEPVFAVLFKHGRWPSGTEKRIADFKPLAWENELCLTMSKTLRGPLVTEAAAQAAVATVAPAMEIVETRGPNTPDLFNVMIADNAAESQVPD
jgi:2-keto-4-pentenoate hydratase